jgi:hypothetical protein
MELCGVAKDASPASSADHPAYKFVRTRPHGPIHVVHKRDKGGLILTGEFTVLAGPDAVVRVHTIVLLLTERT